MIMALPSNDRAWSTHTGLFNFEFKYFVGVFLEVITFGVVRAKLDEATNAIPIMDGVHNFADLTAIPYVIHFRSRFQFFDSIQGNGI